MSNKRFTEEFRIEAVKQVTERDILKKAAVSSTGRRNICRESSSWRIKAQRFSGAFI